MPEFHDRRTSEVKEHNPDHLDGSTENAHDAADRLSKSWMHSAGDHSAVVWAKGSESNPKGTRYEGSHVSPMKGGTGMNLHTTIGARSFKNREVATVNYVKNH